MLCLASGDGQQAPVPAAGARVTSFDNSPRHLELDRQVTGREGLQLKTLEGDMRDLSVFDASFDVVFDRVSNLFIADVRPVCGTIP